MANKIKKVKAPKQRNPLAEMAYFRGGAGAHGQSNKAKRQKDKVALKKGDFSICV